MITRDAFTAANIYNRIGPKRYFMKLFVLNLLF